MSFVSCSQSESAQTRYYFRYCVCMFVGAAVGTLGARYFFETATSAVSTADELLNALMLRQPIRAIMVGGLFTLLVFLCSLHSYHFALLPVLFTLKGLGSAYLVFLCTASAGTRGFLAAVCALLCQTLMLPIQLRISFLLTGSQGTEHTAAKEPLILSVVSVVLACSLEICLIPALAGFLSRLE